MVDDQRQRFEQRLVRIALGQQAHQRAEIADAGERKAAGDEPTGPQRERFHRIGAEMFVEARAPDEAETVAGLQGALQARRSAAAHQPEMASMLARHRLDDRRTLAMAPNADDDAFVAPFHRAAPSQVLIRWRGGGTLERRSAMNSAAPVSAASSAATPGQPARAKNKPPAEPARLEPT